MITPHIKMTGTDMSCQPVIMQQVQTNINTSFSCKQKYVTSPDIADSTQFYNTYESDIFS